MPPAAAVPIVRRVCDAVAYAHAHGVLHRDLKPGNILKLTDRWVVGDFGLCRDTGTGSTTFTRTHVGFGTFAYMAPEQYDNAHEVGPEADVFSLGRILYHMLTGRSPSPYQHVNLVPQALRVLLRYELAELVQDGPAWGARITGSGHAALAALQNRGRQESPVCSPECQGTHAPDQSYAFDPDKVATALRVRSSGPH